MNSDGLVVSNYAREIQFRGKVSAGLPATRIVNPLSYHGNFQSRDMGFRTSIIFMPPVRLLWPFQEHPLAQQLRDLMLENRGRL